MVYCKNMGDHRNGTIAFHWTGRGRKALRVLFLWIFAGLFFSLSGFSPRAHGQEDLPALIKKVEPSIVVIFTYNQEGKILGQGTGFFIDKKGQVVTNYHVLKEGSRSEINTSDGQSYPVKAVIAEDSEGDLIRVLVETPGEKITPLPLSPGLPQVGEKIFIMGTPLGLEKTVSDGIVSAIREIPGFGKIIQVTAPISPGSSGSPVLNMKGEVIGVATFFIMAGQNLNFAIPGERISKMIVGQGESLSARGEKIRRGELVQAEESFKIGLRYLWAERYEMALPYFMDAAEKNPQHAQSFFLLGYCQTQLHRYGEAVGSLQKANRLKPLDAIIHNDLCAVYGNLERYPEALQSCQQAVRLQPDLATAHNNLSWVNQRLGSYVEALESSKQAVRLQPDWAMAHYNLGNAYAGLKKYEQAVEAYKQAIRLQFDYAEAHVNLGTAYEHLGRLEDATDSFKRAISMKPLMPVAHLNLGMVYLKLGDKISAMEEFKILKDLDGEAANRLFNLIYE
jgi:tetratricopeptide (TPR) repeat protein